MPIDRGMDREDMVHIYNEVYIYKYTMYIYTMKYYSAIKRNETGPFVVMWMVLEYVIQNEVSQRKISYINAICEI